MTRFPLAVACAAVLTAAAPATPANAQEPPATACPAPKPAKKGFGLGGLLSAARQAGVGNMLGNGMLGGGKGGQIMGAVAGTAVQAAETGHVDAGSLAGSVGAQGKGGQIAGAVAGTAAKMAQGAGSAASPCQAN